MAEYIQNEKVKPMLKNDGFLFVKDKQVSTKIYWKCNKFASYCKSRAITNDGKVIKVCLEHNHSDDAVNIEVLSFMKRVKQDAKGTRDSPYSMINIAFSRFSESAAQILLAVSSLERTLHNV